MHVTGLTDESVDVRFVYTFSPYDVTGVCTLSFS